MAGTSLWHVKGSIKERLREVSDRLCREYGLSVIENPKKAEIPVVFDAVSMRFYTALAYAGNRKSIRDDADSRNP